MFLTKECDYAIRVVRCLTNMEVKSVRTICENESMPLPFAYKILKKLEKARIVRSYRGAAGGYQLLKKPELITIHEIVNAVDSNLFVNECLIKGYECKNNQEGRLCKVHVELSRVQDILSDALREKNMLELV